MLERYAYLNAGTFGPLPRATVEAMQEVEARELEEGRVEPRLLRARAGRARDSSAATLAAASSARRRSSIALTGSTTEGCNIVLRGLGIGPGDEVVTTDSEHPGLFGGLVASGADLRIAEIRDLPAAEVARRDPGADHAADAADRALARLLASPAPCSRSASSRATASRCSSTAPRAAGAIPVDVRGARLRLLHGLGAEVAARARRPRARSTSRAERLEECRVAARRTSPGSYPEYELEDGRDALRGLLDAGLRRSPASSRRSPSPTRRARSASRAPGDGRALPGAPRRARGARS